MRLPLVPVLLSALALSACPSEENRRAPGSSTRSRSDAGSIQDGGQMGSDGGPLDVDGGSNSGPADSGLADSGLVDSGPADSGPADSGPVDSGLADSGLVDSGPADSGLVDSGPADSGPADSGPQACQGFSPATLTPRFGLRGATTATGTMVIDRVFNIDTDGTTSSGYTVRGATWAGALVPADGAVTMDSWVYDPSVGRPDPLQAFVSWSPAENRWGLLWLVDPYHASVPAFATVGFDASLSTVGAVEVGWAMGLSGLSGGGWLVCYQADALSDDPAWELYCARFPGGTDHSAPGASRLVHAPAAPGDVYLDGAATQLGSTDKAVLVWNARTEAAPDPTHADLYAAVINSDGSVHSGPWMVVSGNSSGNRMPALAQDELEISSTAAWSVGLAWQSVVGVTSVASRSFYSGKVSFARLNGAGVSGSVSLHGSNTALGRELLVAKAENGYAVVWSEPDPTSGRLEVWGANLSPAGTVVTPRRKLLGIANRDVYPVSLWANPTSLYMAVTSFSPTLPQNPSTSTVCLQR